MDLSHERTRSPWMTTEVLSGASPLERDLSADIVVIGSGIAGLSVAYELLSRGRQLVVVERGAIGQGMTARTTAHLSSVSDDGYQHIIRRRGEEMARLFHESHATAIDRMARIVEAHAIACDFRRVDGMLFPGNEKGEVAVEKEFAAARKLGVAVERHHGLPFAGHERTHVLRYLNQATFNPALYLRGLAAAILEMGGRIYSDTAIEAVDEAAHEVVLKTQDQHTIRCNSAVVATNSPINVLVAIHTKQAPYRTYAIALALPRGALPDALYWDTLDPYHYVRLQPGEAEDMLIVGGEDHKTGTANDGGERFARLEDWTRRLVPQAGRVTHQWSGQVMEPIDYAGFIGRNPGNRKIYVATGDSGQGMTHGALAGLLIAELITAGHHGWEKLYDPSRKIRRGLGEYVRENATAVRNYAGHVLPGEISSTREVKRGEGAVMRDGRHLIAICRDEAGSLHMHSASCTHAGCIVHWNATECCWECPCHGSHFAADGRVLNGPAVKPLARAGR